MAERGQNSQVPGGIGTMRPVEPGIIERVQNGVRALISEVTGSTWFGPGQPQPSSAPAGMPARQFDYPVAVNVIYTPRSYEQISFSQLRNLADMYDLLRAVIETRKDQLSKMPWDVAVKSKPGESPAALKTRQEGDPRIAKIKAFFERPDGRNNFQTWIRMLAEDMMVLDAMTVWPVMSKGGDLLALEPIDGATIHPLLDAEGRMPLPPDPAYQQVLHGVPAGLWSSDQIIYRPRNRRTHKIYGYSHVEQIIMTVNIGLRRQIHQLEYYTEGNVPDAIIGIPHEWGWTKEQIQGYDLWFNTILSGNTAERRKAKFVPGPLQYQPTKDPKLKDEMDDWLARILCYVFSVPPSQLIRQINRATAQTSQEEAAAEGLTPILLWFEDFINEIIARYFQSPDIKFAFGEAVHEDPLSQAKINDIYVRNGTKSIDEVRTELGLEEIGMPNAYMTPQGPILLETIMDNPEAMMPGQNPNTDEEAGGGSQTQPSKQTARNSESSPPAEKLIKKKRSSRPRPRAPRPY